MIFNQHLDRLKEVQIVRNFMQRYHMQGRLCSQGENHAFLVYQWPYVVAFHDALIENYLEISISEMTSNLILRGSTASGLCLEMGLQNIDILRKRNFARCAMNAVFLSSGEIKMFCLHEHLEAIDKLLPLIEAKGGLSSLRDGTFDSRFDFSTSVQPMYPGLKEKYLQCIGNDKLPASPNA